MLAVLVGRMGGQLGGRQGEDQPPASGIHGRELEHVSEERAIRSASVVKITAWTPVIMSAPPGCRYVLHPSQASGTASGVGQCAAVRREIGERRLS